MAPRAGSGVDALPGVADVGLAFTPSHPLMANAGLGYGYTESVLDGEDRHHRVGGRVAVAARALPWLAAGLRLDARYDDHVAGPGGGGSGFLAQSRLFGRATHALSDEFAFGAQLALDLAPAQGIDNGLSSLSLESRLLSTLQPRRLPFALGFNLGFRLDRTHNAVDHPERLSPSDRVGLGASEANAILVGVGYTQPFRRVDVIAAFGWDVQVGRAASALAQSPMRLSAGARYWLRRSLHLELVAGLSPSARPPIDSALPLYPIEPRLWLHAAIGIYLERPKSRPRQVTLPTPLTTPSTGGLRGVVRDIAGAPISGARVMVGQTNGLSNAHGVFALEALPAGRTTAQFEADGYQRSAVEVEIVPGRVTQLDVPLVRALPAGQIRGTVRALDGSPLRASVRVEPLGLQLDTSPDGTFAVDVLPGEYTIWIEAAGYRSQQRPVLVEENGVTVILVDLGAER